MNKTWLVSRNEIVSTFSRKSFLFTAFGLPLIGVLIFLGVSVLKGDASGTSGEPGAPAPSAPEPELKAEGYVDHSGLLTERHVDVPPGLLVPFANEASARQAQRDGEIDAYYVIPADYVASGDLIYVNPNIMPFGSLGQTWAIRRTLFNHLLGNDPERIARARNVMEVQTNALTPPRTQRDEDNPLTFYVPYGTMMIFYMVILMSSSLLLNSVGDEKKNRVMEVLLVSVSPRQMLTGKIVGLGVLGLLQAVLWAGTGWALLRVSGRTLSLPPGFELPLSILLWGMLFFLLGYGVYASLMAGLGALAPNVREATQSVILVIWPLIVPLFFFVSLIEKTHGPLAVGLSLFPLTAPVAMMTRLAVGGIPIWQPLLAALLLLLAIVLVVRAIARVFHAQNLLSGQPLSVRRFVGALLGRG